MNDDTNKKHLPQAPRREEISQQDLRLINDLNAALQQEKHKGLYWSVMLLFVFLVVFVIWAYNSTLEEVTRGQGSIIPSSREQIIQSIDPGIVTEMLVKEGDIVDKGQILLKLDDTRSSAIFRESEAKVNNLEAMQIRLKAEAYGAPLEFPPHIDEELKAREVAAFNAHLRQLQDAVSSLKESKALLDKEIAITAPMVKQGVVSEVELLRMRRQSSDLALQIAERGNKYASDANNELIRVESDLAQAKENMAMRADPVDRALMRAPVRGIVKNIRINTVGGVISAGQDIMEIVPLDDKLLVEAYIRPQDVAFIHPGQTAVVKLSAYDYAIYGGLEGKVTLLSPDTLRDQKRPGELKLDPNEAYYRVIIQTDKNDLTDKNGKTLPIIPGMIANVDIKTGEKTVFQYLIKPITRLKQAMQER
ncbi:MAG: HlyD family type I secretion periplasmic adaptor subunit [Neisseria sp.]|nr:HlyD family type I secretion periplasmic adaptor subunit [Neisseria sp.]